MFLGAVVALLTASATTPTAKGPKWLSDAVFYQIYPSSFQDSDGNGIGDLPGIISRLDYIQSLGVNALWLNPVYESGWFDGGYDIIDFYRIDPRFGTNSDMVRLIDEAHKRGLRVCLDLVAGHTSDRCRWFVESATADPNSRYSDYYIWPDSISAAERAMVRDYLYDYATPDEQLYKSMIALILRSAAARCIIPMQDWLGLDNAARINKPSTVGQNWRWRLKKTQLTKKLQKEICQLTTRYGRMNWA